MSADDRGSATDAGDRCGCPDCDSAEGRFRAILFESLHVFITRDKVPLTHAQIEERVNNIIQAVRGELVITLF